MVLINSFDVAIVILRCIFCDKGDKGHVESI